MRSREISLFFATVSFYEKKKFRVFSKVHKLVKCFFETNSCRGLEYTSAEF